MPGESFQGPLPAADTGESALAEMLRRDVVMLAETIGERNVVQHHKLLEAAAWIEKELAKAGHAVEKQSFVVRGRECFNLSVELKGTARPDETIVIGAHYDSVEGCPGANDNGTGVAATLALARRFAGKPGDRTLRFVFFANEEPPYFQTDQMGSFHYAQGCRERNEKIVGMISLETIGYFSDEAGSQQYPFPFGLMYPTTGNFIAFVGNSASQPLVEQAVGSFRRQAKFPSEGAALPGWISGVGWSDHWSFWEAGYPALMITDTAPFRYPHYHLETDTPDKIDYGKMAKVVLGVEHVVRELAEAGN
ncbi:MAG: M28 family peptidase [Planctomycetia bacterium]|nr:M28 family peptidase [Planctomycetia bacterium]